MKTIGIIGGISWHSTAIYYSLINKLIAEKLGMYNSAKILLHSINYYDYKRLQEVNNWTGIEIMLSEIAINLERAGADCILISCNTAHIIADTLVRRIKIPFIHIADVTALDILGRRVKKIGLLGTKFIMGNSFFIERLNARNIDVLVPDNIEQEYIHQSILTELAKGDFNSNTRNGVLEIISLLGNRGAEAIVLGCTEIGMLISQSESNFTLLDTTIIHSKAAVEYALSENYEI